MLQILCLISSVAGARIISCFVCVSTKMSQKGCDNDPVGMAKGDHVSLRAGISECGFGLDGMYQKAYLLGFPIQYRTYK